MGINAIALGLLGATIAWMSFQAFFKLEDGKVSMSELPWVPIDVRKLKVYVSQTRDAGMFVERQRRLAILANPVLKPSFKGSTNGSVEYYLTGIAVGPPRPVCPPDPIPVVWSNGDADDAICDNVDAGGAFGGYDVVDFGGASGNVCDV